MRVLALRTFFLVLLFILAINLFLCQVINGHYYLSLSEQNRIRPIPVPALRGSIFDSHGLLLAGNRPSYDIDLIPEDFDRNKLVLLTEALNISKSELEKLINKKSSPLFAPVVIKSDATMDEAFRLEELRAEIDGVHVEIRGRRNYPLGPAAAHLTGYIGMIDSDEYKSGDPSRFLFSDYIGRSGIEKSLDHFLRGYHGGKQVEVNSRGRVLRTLSERRPVRGQDIYLTIDAEFQAALYELVKDKRASIALMDIASDDVLALVSNPSYDPNAFVTPLRLKERMEYLKSPERAMVDIGVRTGFPLGSVFKLVVALAGLQEGIITTHTSFTCGGNFVLKSGQRPFKCWKSAGHGTVDLPTAIEQSCNVYFYNTGNKLGADRMARYARELGLGSAWDNELGRLFPGVVPDQSWKITQMGERWYQGETVSFAIGQSYLLVSPLQVLRLVATIARDGEVSEPHLIKREDALQPKKPPRAKIDVEHFRTVKQAMQKVVQSRWGTGQLAHVEGLSIAGKTGTAQAPAGEDHSWFAGFAPFENPKVAIVVFVEHGGSGGHTAAPLAARALEMWNEKYERAGLTDA